MSVLSSPTPLTASLTGILFFHKNKKPFGKGLEEIFRFQQAPYQKVLVILRCLLFAAETYLHTHYSKSKNKNKQLLITLWKN